jgi:hypothetical protein
MYGEKKKCVQNFSWETSRKSLFVRPMIRWEDNIKIDLREIGCGGVNWTKLAHDMFQW